MQTNLAMWHNLKQVSVRVKNISAVKKIKEKILNDGKFSKNSKI